MAIKLAHSVSGSGRDQNDPVLEHHVYLTTEREPLSRSNTLPETPSAMCLQGQHCTLGISVRSWKLILTRHEYTIEISVLVRY